MSISIDNQSKSLEQLTTRVDAIEERRSQRSSRSQSRASGRGENRQPYDVPAQVLESALLNSREQRERKAGFQSIFDDDPAYVPPRTASHTLNRKTPGAEKATPILRPTRFMPSIAGCYANPNDIGKFWAEICTPNNPLYEHDTKHPPKVPQGYSGEWVITDENPPRWAFVGEDLEDVERRKKMEELESKAKMQREAERLEKTRKERTDELRNDEEGNRMFAYHRNDRPSSRRMKEDSDSDNEFFKNKNKLPVQPYRSNTTYRPTVGQSPSFNRRSSTNQARSYPPPSKDRTSYRPPDPYISDSDDEQRKRRRPSRKTFNIQSENESSDDYIVNTRIQKIDASVIGILAVDQEAPGPVSDQGSTSSHSSEDESSPATSLSFHNVPASQFANVFSNGIRRTEHTEVKLAGVDKFTIDEIPPAPHIGTGVSYLTTEPCPIKAWVGEAPSSDAPLKPGVADSGSPASVIGRNMLADNAELLQAPTNLIFQGLGKSRTTTEGYVVMPVYLPSAAAMAGDTRKARIAKITVEFQVVEHCPAGFLLGRDAMKAYKMVIDEENSAIWVNSIVPPIKVPITEGTRYDSHRIDSRIFIAETTCIKPGERLFVPVRYQVPDESTPYMFASPRANDKQCDGYVRVLLLFAHAM